ncbi:MAG: ParA family protein [Myxococcota bacterium]
MRNLLKVGLRRLVQSSTPDEPRHAAGAKRAVVVAVATQKGGVGKTTTAVSVAAALARFHGLVVLVVDLDPQGHVATSLRSTGAPASAGLSLAKVLEDEGGAEVLDAVIPTGIDRLSITRSDTGLAATEDLLGTRIGKEFVLRDKLRVTRTHFDVIVLDCPPNQGNLTVNGLCAADQVLIPCDPSPLALKGVEALVHTISQIALRLNPTVDVLGVLLTRVDGRNVTLNDAIVGEIEHTYGDALLPVRIGINASLSKAQHAGLDIFAFDPDSRAAQQYKDLASHLVSALAQ